MRALVKSQPGPGLELMDVAEPAPAESEVLIRVLRTGVCGSDLHLERWDTWAQSVAEPPLIIGHEIFGHVAELGSGVGRVKVGDRVSVEGHLVCQECRNCRGGRRHLCERTSIVGVHRAGGFADYVAVPADNVWVHDADVADDVAAIFDPLGNAVHTALTFPLAGEDVVITGAGPIGVMAVTLARHVGARNIVVTDASDYRLALAEAAGADLALNVARGDLQSARAELSLNDGFGVGLEMSGAPTATRDMLANLARGGRIAMLGMPSDPYAIDWNTVIGHMITIKGIHGRRMFDTWYAMSGMLSRSPRLAASVKNVITNRFPAERWQDAFATTASGQCGKVVLDWS